MNKTYVPLHVHSHFSLLDGLSKPEHLSKRLTECEMPGMALTDHGSLNGAVVFLKEMKKAQKQLILGCELYISEHDAEIKNENNRRHTHMLVLAKNDAGWRDLLALTAKGNTKENFYYKPRLSLNQLKPFLQNRNLILFGGHWGSTIADAIISKDKIIDLTAAIKIVNELKEVLLDDLYLEAQLVNSDPENLSLVESMRVIAKRTGVQLIATPDAHYAFPDQWEDQHILLATNLNKTLHQCTDPAFGMSGFFKCHNYHVPSYDEMISYGNTEEELENTLEVASKCTAYKEILKSPIAPPFECPNGYSGDSWLRKLCNDGWTKLPTDKDEQLYRDRLEEELSVLEGANLASYFLVIKDILDYVHTNGWLSGPGRGSAAGCLVSYLIGITQVDPIPYGLLFSRFYNEGRNAPGRISMPDIDIDIPAGKREQIINYIKDKFGHDKVSQMATYQTMKGRGALKAVLRAHNAVSAAEQNIITKFFPEEAKIMDELQVMKEEEGESSIIQWTLENSGDKLREWCFVNEAGELEGPLAKYFAQAIRLEGTKANMSKHASGILIGPAPLDTLAPMVYDTKTESPICGFEMRDAEDAGLLKFDILGLSLLDKLMGVSEILEFGN